MIKRGLHILILVLSTLVVDYSYGQSRLERSSINSGGNSSANNSFILESTIGQIEVDFQSSTSYVLSQGFQQGNSLILLDTLAFNLATFNTSCENFSDGSAIISSISGGIPPYTIEWSNGVTDTIVKELSEGSYQVRVVASNGAEQILDFDISSSTNSFCELVFYSGFTPNGDNINDLFIIDNIGLFPENTLSIYNRYGETVRSFDNYNNSTIVWDGSNKNGNILPAGTYFYIFEANGEFRKGWVELTKIL